MSQRYTLTNKYIEWSNRSYKFHNRYTDVTMAEINVAKFTRVNILKCVWWFTEIGKFSWIPLPNNLKIIFSDHDGPPTAVFHGDWIADNIEQSMHTPPQCRYTKSVHLELEMHNLPPPNQFQWTNSANNGEPLKYISLESQNFLYTVLSTG